MSKLIDLAGQRFGRWSILERVPGKGPARWRCRCSCGKEVVVVSQALRSGASQSCGCLRRDLLTTHDEGGSRWSGNPRNYLYSTWSGIKQRTGNPNSKAYADYGGRGIKMHEPWLADYPAFRDWILAHLGERPRGMSLDRIDVDGNYEPGNLRWLDQQGQMDNRRTNIVRVNQLQRQRDDLAELVLRLMGHA